MKLSHALFLFSSSIARATAGNFHRPYRIDYEMLMKSEAFESKEVRQGFLNALRNVGLVSITGIPSASFKKRDVLSWSFHECAESSKDAQEYVFPDFTRRLTLATHTMPNSPTGIQEMFGENNLSSLPKVCKSFSDASENFRQTVTEVTQVFATRVSGVLEDWINAPLMVAGDGSYAFETFSDVVAQGEHLEHFHSYQRIKNGSQGDERDSTIEMHTDQGLFIVFAPGQLVKNSHRQETKTASGLYIQLPDGSSKGSEVAFDEQDDLVIMLGDGINRILNPKMRTNDAGSSATVPTLRATPHALYMPFHEEEEVRVWYGRMVLPPAQAHSHDAGMSHGELRQKMIRAVVSNSEDQEILTLGCSDSGVSARILHSDEGCDSNHIYCWHTCMSVLDYNVSEDICASRSLRLECINPRNQIYVEGHGDYFPGCTNSTENATDYPKLPSYPRNDSSCPESAWKNFSSAEGYKSTYEILQDVAKIHWNVLDGGVIEGKLDFNGLFGYLGFGFANETDLELNGMLGGSVIMALPGGDYSPVTGLNLSLGPEVNEYHIGTETAFRHWDYPVKSQSGAVYSVVPTDCFVSLLFKTDSINGVPFNVTGTNSMIWAANPTDRYAGYHGNTTRSRIVLNWSNGTGSPFSISTPSDATSASVGSSAFSASSTRAFYGSASFFLFLTFLISIIAVF